MDSDRKRELAEEVVDITVMNRVRSSASKNGAPDPDMAEKTKKKWR